MNKLTRLILVALFFLLNTGISYAYISISGETEGSWINPVYDSTDYVRIYNNDSGSTADFVFGLAYPGSYSSRFRFDGKGSDGDADWNGLDDGSSFLIGEFSYRNGVNPSTSVNGVQGVDLRLSMNITDPLSLLMNSFSYDFSIDTTHNITGDPYLDRDFVNILGGTTTETFMYNSKEYTLQILGFSSDGGSTFKTDFTASENSITYAALYARVTSAEGPNPNPVPEPASMLLFGSGLLGMFRFKKRFFSKKK